MKRNIVFLPCVNAGDGRSNPYRFSINSWKYWCDKNDCDLILMDQLLCPVDEMKISWQRWYALDILENSDINYDQVLIVDADTIVHPDTPNFFKLTDHKLAAVHNEGCYDWIIRSMENYHKHMFNDKPLLFNFWEYINCGFMIFNESHKPFLKKFLDFYHNNKESILKLQETYYVGTDQPVFNHFLREQKVDYKLLPYEFNMCDLPRKEILDNDLTLTKVGWVYHFNAIPQQLGKPEQWMEKIYNKLYNEN
jgi:hypothetical protein